MEINDQVLNDEDRAQVEKLTAEIENAKDTIEDLYFELGKKCYREYKTGEEVDGEEAFHRLDELFEAIEHAENTIGEIKAALRCPSCGERVEKRDNFCRNCGMKLPKDEPVAVAADPEPLLKCSKCGADLLPGALFCGDCGERI